MSDVLRVRAANPAIPVWVEGKTIAHQGHPDSLIRGEVVEVPNTRYYRRRIAAGDLVLVEDHGKAKGKKE